MFHAKLFKSSGEAAPLQKRAAMNGTGLTLVSPNASAMASSPSRYALLELAIFAARRCSSFFAEASVLVLVFGILDLFMLKGRVELSWIVGSLAISVGLLLASIAMDFSAHRWIKAHP
jgi:hypothetical protein